MINKKKLIQIEKSILALGLTGVILGTVGCKSNEKTDRMIIDKKYSNVEDYYKFSMQNGEAIKLYNSENLYLLYNKETYEVNEYIFKNNVTWFGGAELYDLESEEMLVYGDGINTTYNEEFYADLIENNYQVPITQVSDYVEGYKDKDYYSLDEIKKLEPEILDSLKIINEAKTK